MALPNSFAGAATISSVWWDQNYAALGSICAIQCSVSGINTLTLSPLPNQPTPSYNNYQTYLGVAVSTNNAGVNAQIGTSASLVVYKESTTGPITCTGGEFVALEPFYLIYDSALSGGGGGFHLRTSSPSYLLGQSVTFASVALTNTGVSSLATQGGISAVSVIFSSGGFRTTDGIVSSTATVSGLAQLNGGATVSTTGIAVGNGPFETRCLSSLASITYGAIGANTTSVATVTLTGARPTDNVNIAYTTVSTGIAYDGYVQANDTVVVRAFNVSNGSVTPAAQIYRVTAWGFN